MSDATKHTKGPWKAVTVAGYAVAIAIPTGGEIAYVPTTTPDGPTDEDIANAELIARAPDLLAQRDALLAFAQVVARSACLQQRNGERCICFACEARAAISLAGGGK